MPTFCEATRRTAIRGIVVLACLVGAVCATVRAEDKDPVKEKLFAAKVAYDEELRQYRKAADEWFDKRDETARKDGNKKTVDQIKGERRVFDESGELPKIAPTALQQKPVIAKKTLEAAYGQAVKDYIKAKNDDRAAAIETEWKEFRTRKTPGVTLRPADVTTKEDLHKYLTDTVWTLGDGLRFKSDGYVDQKFWASGNLVTKWEVIDRRTVLLWIEKGREENRYQILTFAEDMSEFRGYEFNGRDRVGPCKRKP